MKDVGTVLITVAKRPLVWGILGFLGVGIFFAIPGQKPQALPLSVPSAAKDPSAALLTDDDADGLSTWQEQIYGSDPERADTDGDGTLDGEEVKAGRNPLVKGPEDLLPALEDFTQTPPDSSDAEPNLTQSLLKTFSEKGGVAALVQPQQNGTLIASQLLIQEVDDLVSARKLLPAEGLPPIPEVKTLHNTSPAAVTSYLNRAADILTQALSPRAEDDLDVYLEILQSGNFSRLSELAPFREAAAEGLERLGRLPVPETLAWFHEQELRYLAADVLQLKLLQRTEADPAAALSALTARVDLKVARIQLQQGELAAWLTERKIRLDPDTKASYLLTKL